MGKSRGKKLRKEIAQDINATAIDFGKDNFAYCALSATINAETNKPDVAPLAWDDVPLSDEAHEREPELLRRVVNGVPAFDTTTTFSLEAQVPLMRMPLHIAKAKGISPHAMQGNPVAYGISRATYAALLQKYPKAEITFTHARSKFTVLGIHKPEGASKKRKAKMVRFAKAFLARKRGDPRWAPFVHRFFNNPPRDKKGKPKRDDLADTLGEALARVILKLAASIDMRKIPREARVALLSGET